MLRNGWFALLALFLLRALVTFAPAPWSWGLDSLSNRSWPMQAAGLVLFALALLPPWIGGLPFGLSRASAPHPRFVLAGLGGLAWLLTALLPCGHSLLGDTQTYLSTLEQGLRAAGAAHREPLPQAIMTWAYAVVGRSLGSHGTFRVVELPLGAAAIVAAVALARRLAISLEGRLCILSVTILGGGLQLFAAYPEFYPFSLAAALAFAWAGCRTAAGGGGFALVVLFFALAGLSHAQFVFAAPALVYLAWRELRAGRRLAVGVAALALPAGVLGLLAVLGYPFQELGKQVSKDAAFLPPFSSFGGTVAYAVWSPWHLLELLNVVFLVSPALLALAFAIPARKSPAKGSTPAGADAVARFLALLAAGPALFALFANPALGMVRDWDIYVLPITLAGLALAAAFVRRIEEQRNRDAGRFVLAVVLTSLLHGTAWLALNHSGPASTARLRRVAASASLFGWKTHGELWRYLGSADITAGRPADAVESLRQAIQVDPEERMSYRLLATLLTTRADRDVAAGLREYHAALADVPHREAYRHYGAAFAAAIGQRQDLALDEAASAASQMPQNAELLAAFGDFLRRSGRIDDARAVYDRSLGFDPLQPRATIGRACLLGMNGDLAGARAATRDLLARLPWSMQAQQFQNLLDDPATCTPERLQVYLFVR